MKVALGFTAGVIVGAAAMLHAVTPAHRLFVAFCEAVVAPKIEARQATKPTPDTTP